MKILLQGATALLLLSTLNSQSSTVFAQGTAFTYQGRLQNSGNPANGLYDVRFTVWDAPTNGDLIAGPLTNSTTGVSNGLFAVTLDFGNGVFTGPARWLELDVRTNGGSSFTPLSPLEPVMPAPYAIMSSGASNLLGTLPVAQLSGTLPATQLPASVLTNNQSGVTLSGTFNGNGAGLTNVPGTIPSGAIVLSLIGTNAALISAGFAPANFNLPTIPAVSWVEATNPAPWAGRDYPNALAFNGRMWIFGGYGGNVFTRTEPEGVWSSPDGVNWTEVSSNGFPARDASAALVFNGQMWAIGGEDINGNPYGDALFSADGVNWASAANNAAGGARAYSAAVVFNGRMWVMGGTGYSSYYNDVWSSGDGTNWTQVTSHAAWSARAFFAAVVFNNKMWFFWGG